MSTKDFRGWDVPLYTGPFYGVRDFRVTPDGYLTGVTYREVWKVGENVATCYRTKWVDAEEATEEDEARVASWPPSIAYSFPHPVPGWVIADPRSSARKRVPDSCQGVEAACECGYWSYHSSEISAWSGVRSVTGVVANYGKITVGSKGFRAEKARILALALPGRHQVANDRVRNSNPFHWDRGAEDQTLSGRDLAAAVRANYPGVHLFRSADAMLEQYPTTDPRPLVTPQENQQCSKPDAG